MQPPKPSEGRHACVQAWSRSSCGDEAAPVASSHDCLIRTLALWSGTRATDGSVVCAVKCVMGATAYRSTLLELADVSDVLRLPSTVHAVERRKLLA